MIMMLRNIFNRG